MNDQPQIMSQSQILQNNNHLNYVVWPRRPPPFPPDNAVVFHGALSRRKIFKPDKRNEFRRLKGRRFHFHQNKNKFESRYAPYAPRNTTSFLIRSKRSRGSDDTPPSCPVTPAVLPTPIFSPLSEFWIDMAKEEWGVDGYGSMKGLIRLRSRSPRCDEDDEDDTAEYGGGGSSDSDDVEERAEVEKRLDHDLSRFEMIRPANFYGSGGDDQIQTSFLENRVDEQENHIAQLEEENMTLKDRLFLMERELEELRTRVQCLETDGVWRACRDRIGENDVCSEKSVGNVNDDDDDDNDGGGETTTFSGKFSVQ